MRKTLLVLPFFASLLFACKQDAATTNPASSASVSPASASSASASPATSAPSPSAAATHPAASSASAASAAASAPGAAHVRGCTVVGKLPKWRYGLAVAEVMEKSPVGEKVLVIGGHQRDSGGELADVDVFDVNTKTFSRGTPLPAPRAGHVAASGYEFKHVIVAGGNQKSVDVWDVEKKAWKSIGALKTAPLYSMAVGQSIGTTFLAGGDLQYKGALSSGAYLVTPYAVTATTDLPSPRVATFATTTSKSGFAVLGGGPDLAYDEKAKQWKPLPADDGIAKIFKAPSYPKGERIYATYQQVATSDAVYQRSTGDEWVKVPTQKNHAGGAAVSLGGGMFVVGGINEDAASAELCTF